MQAIAEQARHLPDAKTRRLIDWVRERMCPSLPSFGSQHRPCENRGDQSRQEKQLTAEQAEWTRLASPPGCTNGSMNWRPTHRQQSVGPRDQPAAVVGVNRFVNDHGMG